jgi:hypothetical protein
MAYRIGSHMLVLGAISGLTEAHGTVKGYTTLEDNEGYTRHYYVVEIDDEFRHHLGDTNIWVQHLVVPEEHLRRTRT